MCMCVAFVCVCSFVQGLMLVCICVWYKVERKPKANRCCSSSRRQMLEKGEVEEQEEEEQQQEEDKAVTEF